MQDSNRFSILRIFKYIGPGVLVAATGVGAGDLATATFTGNTLGVAVLWAVLLGAFLKFVLNEGLARWQLATGETLLEGAIDRLSRVARYIFLPYLLLWSFFVGSALISACGVAMHAIVPVFDSAVHGKIVFGIAHSLLGVLLVLLGGFALFEIVMSVCIGIMFLVVLITASLICENWGGVVQGMFIPAIPQLEGGGLGWTVALMGGVGGTLTVLCYGYWIRETAREGEGALKICRIDLGFAYAATAIFGVAMVIIGSAIPELEGKGAKLVVNLANALQAELGTVGKWAFLVGAWAAIFSSLFGVWQSVPYIFADFLRLVRQSNGSGESIVNTSSWAYRGYLIAIATVPMVGLFVNFVTIQKVYAIVGALFMPMLAFVLLILNGRRKWVGDFRNRPITVVVLIATLAGFLFFGYLKIQKTLGF
jgi:Mn2+/Fe2+ NRAMP family transporter